MLQSQHSVARKVGMGRDYIRQMDFVTFVVNSAGDRNAAEFDLSLDAWEAMGQPSDLLLTIRPSDD